jgi:RNA polymerase sigma factor (sigma-70 family)
MESFRPKSQDEKSIDIQNVTDILSTDPSPNEAQNEDLSLEEIKRRFPARYQIFLETLRLVRNVPEKELEKSVEELKTKALWLNALRESLATDESRENIGLHPRQLRTFEKLLAALEANITRGHIVLPTGSGKTVVFSKCIQAICKDPRSKVLVVSPTKIILEQNKGKVETFGDVATGAYYGREKDLDKQVTVTTYASFMRSEELNLESYDLIILDEAHRALSDARTERINALKKPVILGFTATPEFHEEKQIEDILDYEIDSMNIKEGVMEGLLSSLKVYIVRSTTEIDDVKLSGKDFNEESLRACVDTPERNELIVSTYMRSPILFDRQGVTYCVSRDHARRIAKMFNERKVSASYIGGDLSDNEIEIILTNYRNGKIKMLCNADILVEGFDETEAEVCLNARPTLSKVVAEQRGGRVCRKSKRNPRKIAKIVEFIDEWKNSDQAPILFSEVAGSAEILGPDMQNNRDAEPERVPFPKDLDIRSPGETGPDLLQSDPELVMSVTRKFKGYRQESRYKPAPEGWLHTRFISQETSVPERRINSFADSYRIDHSEWFKNYLTATNRLCEHYDPILVDIIRKEFLPELRDKINVREFAKNQHIEESYAGLLFSLVVEERKDIPVIMVGGEIYLDKEKFKKWYTRKKLAETKRQERKEKHALDKYLDRETEPTAEKEFYKEIDTSPSFDLSGDVPDETEPISEEDVIKDAERDAYTKMLLDDVDGLTYDKKDVEARELNRVFEVLLKDLTEREATVLYHRYYDNMTFEEIAPIYKVTRERIRGIETKALHKLRHPSRSVLIEGYHEELKSAVTYPTAVLTKVQTIKSNNYDYKMQPCLESLYGILERQPLKLHDLTAKERSAFDHSLNQINDSTNLSFKEREEMVLAQIEFLRTKFNIRRKSST